MVWVISRPLPTPAKYSAAEEKSLSVKQIHCVTPMIKSSVEWKVFH